MSGRRGQYPPEFRERAARMVAECCGEHASQWETVRSVASKLGIGTTETVRNWVRAAEVDAGVRPGVTSQESAEMRRLRAEARVSPIRAADPEARDASAASKVLSNPESSTAAKPAAASARSQAPKEGKLCGRRSASGCSAETRPTGVRRRVPQLSDPRGRMTP